MRGLAIYCIFVTILMKPYMFTVSVKLELFHFSSADMKDAYGNSVEPRFASPSYRINAYDIGSLKGGLEGRLWNTSSKKRLSCKENKMTMFFITEKTMRNYDWGDIHRNQLYVKK